MAPRPRDLAAHGLLAAGGLLVVPLLAEVGLRLGGYEPERGKTTACVFDAGRTVLLDCYATNPRGYFDLDLDDPAVLARYQALGIKRLDNAAARAPHCVEVRYNAVRFRGDEIPSKAEGVRRVAVLGDSFTEGQGVREADTYPRVLGTLLERVEPGRWEVLNCGRRASDFPELVAEMEEVLALDPDLVIYGMVPNDPEQTPEFRARRPRWNDLIEDQVQAQLVRRYAQLGFFDSRLVALVRGRLETRRVTRESLSWYRDLYGPPNADGWRRTQDRLRRMHDAARERGVGFLVAAWPLLVGLEETDPRRDPLASAYEAAARFAAAAGIPRHDLRPALAGRPSESLWVHPVDMHPNERAHRLAAESLAPVVRDIVARDRPVREGAVGPAKPGGRIQSEPESEFRLPPIDSSAPAS